MAMKDAAAWVRRYGTPAQVYQKDRKGFFASETFMRADRFAERLLSIQYNWKFWKPCGTINVLSN